MTDNDARRGGLPDDESLKALAGAAFGAPRPPSPARPAATVVAPKASEERPAPNPVDQPSPAESAVEVAKPAAPASRPRVAAREPATPAASTTVEPAASPQRKALQSSRAVPSQVVPQTAQPAPVAVGRNRVRTIDDTLTQVTIMVRSAVVDAVESHQLEELRSGRKRPTNTAVVLGALNTAANRFPDILASAEPEPVPGLLFSGAAPGRRHTHGRATKVQFSFRPTFGELALIDQLSETNGFENRSVFIDLVLGDVLRDLLPAGG